MRLELGLGELEQLEKTGVRKQETHALGLHHDIDFMKLACLYSMMYSYDKKTFSSAYVPFFSNVVFSVIASNGSVVKNGAAGPISPDLRLQDSGADKRGTLRQKRPQRVLSRVPRLTPTS